MGRAGFSAFRNSSRLFRWFAFFFLLAAGTAQAATFTWDGGGSNDNWSTAANWVGDVAPSCNVAHDYVFSGSTRLSPKADNSCGSWLVNSITFSGSSAFTITGQQLTIGSGGITNNSTGTQTLGNQIGLSASQTWAANSGNLVINGYVSDIPTSTHTFTLTGAGSITVNNQLNGLATLRFQGSGTRIINDYVKASTIEFGGSGTATFSSASSFNANATVVNGSGNVNLNGTINSGTLTLNGTGTTTLGGNVGTGQNNLTSTVVNGGTLIMAVTGGGDAINGTLTINNGGTVNFGGNNQIPDWTSVTLNTGSTLDMNGTSQTFANLVITGDTTIDFGGGNSQLHVQSWGSLSISNDVTITISNWSATDGTNDVFLAPTNNPVVSVTVQYEDGNGNVYASGTWTPTSGGNGSITPGTPTASLHHLLIQHTGRGLTCTTSTLTIVACANADCSTPYEGGVTGTLTAAGVAVTWIGGSGSFSIPSGSSSITKSVQPAAAGTITWGVSSGTPYCDNTSDGTAANTGAQCQFSASTAGFIVSSSATGGAATVPAQRAGTASATHYLRAIDSTNNPAVCTPAISGAQGVTIGYTCNDPASCQSGNRLTVNSTAVPAAGGNVSLTFDVNGAAPLTLRYDDAGRITVNASKSVTPPGGSAVTLNGSTNAFVVAPASFTVVPAGPYVAGQAFTATVTAKNASGNTTPNFGKESNDSSATLASVLTEPPGGNNPSLGGTASAADAAFVSGNGAAAATGIIWGEVGKIDLTATLANYMGSGLAVTGSGSAGTFIPAYFDTEVTPGAGVFTYSCQPFTVKATARNTVGVTTKNYKENYAKIVTLSDANAVTNGSATLGSFGGTAIILPENFAGGVGTVDSVTYTFTGKNTAPLETRTTPTVSAPLALRAVDADGVTSEGHTEGTTPIRSGRARVGNAYGVSQLPLKLPVYVENYIAAGGWTSNGDTSSAASYVLQSPTSVNLSGTTGASGSTNFSWSSSHTEVAASAPGAGNKGYADVTVDVPCWLEFPWSNGKPDPTGRATFGVYNNNSNLIYMRERY